MFNVKKIVLLNIFLFEVGFSFLIINASFILASWSEKDFFIPFEHLPLNKTHSSLIWRMDGMACLGDGCRQVPRAACYQDNVLFIVIIAWAGKTLSPSPVQPPMLYIKMCHFKFSLRFRVAPLKIRGTTFRKFENRVFKVCEACIVV